jgi:hypothetical protein
MNTAAFSELSDGRTQLFPLAVGQYHRMIESGILPEGEPFELLDGHLLRKDRSAVGEDPTTVGNEHAYVVDLLNELNPKLRRHGCYMRIQQPITLPPHDEPEPDGSIVRGSVGDYRDRHPKAADVLCVIEVADASLRRDRNTKLRVYADAGIACYLLFNLPDRVVEVYTRAMKGTGRYARADTLKPKDHVKFPLPRGGIQSVPVRKFLT